MNLTLKIYYSDNTVQVLSDFHPSFKRNVENTKALVADIAKRHNVISYKWE